MIESLDFLRELNIWSLWFRLFLAMLFGGVLGIERQNKSRPAGFRTYMLVCMGATLTMLLGQYEFTLLSSTWADHSAIVGNKIDVSRFGAQVINGIGFLGAGTIMVGGRKKVKGLTTAAGLWASGCMGLAIGAGFYECVLLGFLMITLVVRMLPAWENAILEHSRAMNIYIEFGSLDELGAIITKVKSQNLEIREVDITKGREEKSKNPSVIFSLLLDKEHPPHARILAAISELDCIISIEEV